MEKGRSASGRPAPLLLGDRSQEACGACTPGEGPAPQGPRDDAVTKDPSVVMSSQKCFVMFSQSTEMRAHSSGVRSLDLRPAPQGTERG